MKRLFILAALSAALVPAFADSLAETQSVSTARTDIQNVGSPTINNYSPSETTIRQHGLPVSSPASNFVNGPAGDTCANPGDAVSVQTAVVGIAATKGGGTSVDCNDRADPRSMKETGEDAVAITMRHCQNPNKAAAYEDAADLRDAVRARMTLEAQAAAPASFRCPDRLRPSWALEREGRRAPAQRVANSPSADPFIAASGRQYPSR